jgi:hypothetical protein
MIRQVMMLHDGRITNNAQKQAQSGRAMASKRFQISFVRQALCRPAPIRELIP